MEIYETHIDFCDKMPTITGNISRYGVKCETFHNGKFPINSLIGFSYECTGLKKPFIKKQNV